MPFINVNNISMYYEQHGQTGSPIILIMGLASTKISWHPTFIKKLATKHQVIIFDNRGVGQTDKPTTPYSMTQFAADTVGLLRALTIDKAHIMGVSMGGIIAQHVALDYPEHVLSLILGCTTYGPNNEAPPTPDVVAILTRERTGDRAEDTRKGWPIIFTPSYIKEERDFLEERLAISLAYPEQPRYAFELQLAAVMQCSPTLPRLAELKMPTLIQTGTEDVLVPPKNAYLIAQQIPHARLIEYPNAAHGYLFEAQVATTNHILTFLAEVDTEQYKKS